MVSLEYYFLGQLGSISIFGLTYIITKVLICSVVLYLMQLFDRYQDCLILAIAIFATENFFMIQQMGESGLNLTQILVIQAESLIFNTFLIILSQTFHPSLLRYQMQLQPILFRLFSNVFFPLVIGSSFAFLSSYSLKHSFQNKEANFDNFDVLMMILSPIVSFLMAESFTISGLLSLMTCAFLQSIYAQRNLEKQRSSLLLSIFRALSYTTRAICDLLIGIGFGLNLPYIKLIDPVILIGTVVVIQLLQNFGTYLISRKMKNDSLISDLEQKLIQMQNNSKGLLSYTLALQSFNPILISITIINILFDSLIIEPILTFRINRLIKYEEVMQGIQHQQDEVIALDSNNNMLNFNSNQLDITVAEVKENETQISYGCFKSCLLNFHFFTLSNWLVIESARSPIERDAFQRSQQFEKFEDSYESQNTQQIDISRLSYRMKQKHYRTHNSVGDIEMYQRLKI